MQIVTLWLWSGHIQGRKVMEGTFSITRSTFPALRSTVLKDFISFLHEQDIYQYIDHRRTTHEFHYQGRSVVFFSLDDPHKLRGRQHSFIWMNECNDTDFEMFNQAIIRTTHSVYLDYNPTGSPWVRTKIEEDRLINRGDVHLDVSVYTDNPYLPEELIKEIEGLALVDKDLYNVYTKGVWVDLKGLIFKDVKIIKTMPTEGRVFYGIDFGYNDPNCFVKVVINGNDLYIDCLVYKSGMLIDELATEVHKESPYKVYCDSAEPRSIEHLRRLGVGARAAKKGADSVLQGLNYIKQHRVHITERSVESIEEFKRYKWAEDAEGNLIDKPIDKYNHTADAVRYAINRGVGGKLKFL